jgi:hypothetical protein
VANVSPLELQQVGTPTSLSTPHKSRRLTLSDDKCGSTYIDRAFKVWLRKILGKERYSKLDPLCGERVTAHTSEGAKMRVVMSEFDRHKRAFKGEEGVMKIGLPSPLNNISVHGHINQGLLSITA